MSANVEIVQKQRKVSGRGMHPNSRAAIAGKGFKPGQSGNPNGRPKGQSLTAQLRAVLEDTDKKTKKEISRLVAEAIVLAARKGDVSAFREIADRTEGKPEQKKTVTENKTITVIFERPEFANHHTDAPQSPGEDTERIEALQRAGVRATLREITVGEIPVDGSGA